MRKKSTFEIIEARAIRASKKALRDVRAAEAKRSYQAAEAKRDTVSFKSTTTSADTEIRGGLTNLRGRSRALGRDSAYVVRAKAIVVNNVVYTGIGMQGAIRGTRGELRTSLNDAIEDAFCEWWEDPESCHTGGELSGPDLERMLMDQTFEAGEVFVRMHRRPFGKSAVPFCLEVVESERCPHDLSGAAEMNRRTRMGIDRDEFFRPIRYWFREGHPGDYAYPSNQASERVFDVPADDVVHLRVIQRWPQSRGVPWLHAVATTLNNMRGYTEAEIIAARGGANYFASRRRSAWDPTNDADQQTERETGQRVMTLEPGMIADLDPGEELNFHAPNRPNQALDPFMRYMLREVAAGIGVTYESLSKDYSQSNYSSSRLALLDDRDLWRVLQMWFIRTFRHRMFKAWLQQAVLARAIPGVTIDEFAADPVKFATVKYKPRGWSWVDPQKEVAAFKEAILGGLTTRTKVIAATAGGDDIEDVDEERARELDDAKQLGLKFDTDPDAIEHPDKNAEKAKQQQEPPAETETDEDDETDSGTRRMRVVQ